MASSLPDRIREWSWWQSDDWAAYCEAYGSNHGRPIESKSYVVSLQEDPWNSLTKGHRSAITKQGKTQVIRMTTSTATMQDAHSQAAGRQTRTQSTWDLMDRWLVEGKALCATNDDGGWAYFILDKPGAYYASSAGSKMHYLMWTIIEGLKAAGYEWLELGEAHTGGIGTFKKGFSNVTVD